jgi:hypothetical protein
VASNAAAAAFGLKPKRDVVSAKQAKASQSTGSPPLIATRTLPRSASATRLAYWPMMLYAKFGPAVTVASLSESHLNQRNGDAAKAVAGASQNGAPDTAPLNSNAKPMS